MDRRTLCAGLGSLVLLGRPAFAAADYPDRAIRIVDPFPAGSPVDVVARLLAQRLQEETGQVVTVDNRGGAGGTIGAEAVARSAADGYTLLVTSSSTQVVAPALRKSLPYDTARDFTPIALVAYGPTVIVVNPSVPVHSLQEFVAYCKANPGKVAYGSSGPGTILHLTGELFAMKTGSELLHVPYKGAVPASTDLLAGQVQVMFDSISNAAPQVRAGRLRALAVLTPNRSPALPDTPTADELGFHGLAFPAWIGLFGPARLPADVVAFNLRFLRKAFESTDTRDRLVQAGLVPAMVTDAAFVQLLAADQKVVAELVRAAHIPPQ